MFKNIFNLINNKKTFVLIISLLSLLLFACQSNTDSESTSEPAIDASQSNAGKKVLFINSYHAGYEWSDGIESGLQTSLDGSGVTLQFVRMDTKRITDEDLRQAAVQTALAEIDAFAPDIIITADDNAQSYLVVPHLKERGVPIIFVGVNWDASAYGYPTANITGMVEIELVKELVGHLEQYAAGTQVGYLTVDSNTEQKVAEVYNERFFDGGLKVFTVQSLDEFKQAFISAQNEVDILFIGNNAGLNNWDEAGLEAFFVENTRIPTGSINPWMAPYSLITMGKVPEEQGEWAGTTALSILSGTAVSDIPIVENKKGRLILHLDIAEQLDVIFSPSLLKNGEVYPAEK